MKVLWIGDAVYPTGFSKVTHRIVDVLIELGAEVEILGVNFRGDPKHGYPYAIWPADHGGDTFGFRRVGDLVKRLRPDVVVAFNDPWIVAEYIDACGVVPVVGYCPVDGLLAYPYGVALQKLAHLATYTEFGRKQLQATGYSGPVSVIPHGVDLDLFQPMDRAEARKITGLDGHMSEDAIVVLNVNRNQWRKRLDLTVHAFAEWRKLSPDWDSYLALHCDMRDIGWDLPGLAAYYGLTGRVLVSNPTRTDGSMMPESRLRATYSGANFGLSTTLGEGWGLTTMEGMACGLAQAVPPWSALGEWAKGAVRYLPIVGTAAHISCVNVIGGVVDPIHAAEALEDFASGDETATLREAGLALVGQDRFRWPTIGRQFHRMLAQVIGHD